MGLIRLATLAVVLSWLAAPGRASPWVSEQPHPGDFPLVPDGPPAAIVAAPGDFPVVRIAAGDLQADIERVTGRRPALVADAAGQSGPVVIVGTLGCSPPLDELVASGKLEISDLRGQWESFLIATVVNPFPGVPQALVIAGSDRRGTAFGVYELSQEIGVSPWHWWADVTPAKKTALFIATGMRRFGPPSVQYRGIFLNDEDWGLQPWAAQTFEPETGDIGPKTYAKVCELLLRLKANTLWPAMHPCTKAFNLDPRNKQVAADYAVVMGSSHAEPMLRNNVTEWTAPPGAYNYLVNRDGVRAYWEERVRENSRFENIYTLGMRGIHDSHMQGPATDAARIATLEQIFADQRALLAKYLSPRLESVPQIFCAYKEVLDLYRQGLRVPADVTIVWPDDNFGYIRSFATPAELQRPGGFGVYYHLSYLGAPLSYLWLGTTPPALIWEEMSKAYDHGARKFWMVNVGDLKPGEIGTEFFLQMAWDINRWRRDNLDRFLPEWAGREFGAPFADHTAEIMAEYYRVNFLRRPEHLQWWPPGEAARPSPLSAVEINARLALFGLLRRDADDLAATLPPAKRDAFEELVGYPVRGAALANQRYFFGERGQREQALAADAELRQSTRRYNESIAGGKWRGFMSLEPADGQWKSMRVDPWRLPDFPPTEGSATPRGTTIGAGSFIANRADRNGAAWEKIPGFEWTGEAVAIFPSTRSGVDEARLATDAPRLGYEVDLPAAGAYILTAHLLPAHPLVPGRGLRFAVGLDEAKPRLVVCTVEDGSPAWAQGVLNNSITVETPLAVPTAGRHTLRIYGIDAGVVLQRLVLAPAPDTPHS